MEVRTMPEAQKRLGAYYTDPAITRFLSAWAIQHTGDKVLEPSFGGGAFLEAAVNRLIQLGGAARGQVFGFEIDADTHARTSEFAAPALGLPLDQLILGDFFQQQPNGQRYSAVIGNPPFVRYQRFAGRARELGLMRAAEAGVDLSELSSSWAPFVVHATRFLERDGRLAMVVPLELVQAAYGRPVLRFLAGCFGKVTLLMFDRRLFPDLNQDTLLFLGDRYGAPGGTVEIVRLSGVEDLSVEPAVLLQALTPSVVDPEALHNGLVRAAGYRISPAALELYAAIASDSRVVRLGGIASVGIGYVTGANDFFHVSDADAAMLGIPQADLKPAVRRGRDLASSGLEITYQDWQALRRAGGKYWLLYPDGESCDAATHAYIQTGLAAGLHLRYKCRSRAPWWRVPWVVCPDMILTVMSGGGARLVANSAKVVATNSLHAVCLTGHRDPIRVAASAVNTLTMLSAEIEGHALGGGMLKLEPSEASRLLLPLGAMPENDSSIEAIDDCLRQGPRQHSIELGDRLVLEQSLGLSTSDVTILRQALHTLRQWRQQR